MDLAGSSFQDGTKAALDEKTILRVPDIVNE